MYAKEFNKLIKEICKEKNIKVDTMSFEYILRLQKEQKEFYIIGYKFNLNTHSSTAIARDKYATYEILKSKNIPIIEHKIIFSEQLKGGKCTEENLKASKEYFHKNKNKMVLKPNKGKEGINVYFCDKEDKIKSIINKIFKEDNAVVLNPFYNIKNEYRTIYLNGECLITYGKNIPYLIGDGKSNIEDLLMKEMKLNIKDIREENIKEVNLEYIPEKNEKINIFWKHNLNGGAIPEILEDNKKRKKIQAIVKNAAKAININFASIDVIETIEGDLYLLEINSVVFMKKFMEKHPEGKKYVKDIYTKAIEEMLKK